MTVIWSKLALKQVSETADYIETQFGEKSRLKFLEQVFYVASLLENNPLLGIAEPILEDAPLQFRSIIADRYNRLIYHIYQDTIEIADFWDMRRDAKNLKKRLAQ